MRGTSLAIPEGWALDETARARMEHQLTRLGADCSGVVALAAALPPGSSHRVAAEWRSLEPLGRVEPVPGGRVPGAVLARADAEARAVDDGVELGPGAWVVDHGASVHDPWQPLGALHDASRAGRSPFPYRPVVLFLGAEPDPDLADWCRITVNGLLAAGVEGRLAVPAPTGGLHLTRPCAPTPASVAALAPDVVVALDEASLERASRWLGEDRSAIVVEMTQHTSALVETVPWRIGVARGRVRARIGRGVRAPEFAALVRRCCAGPQPLPPSDRHRREERAGRPPGSRPLARGALDPALRIVALVDPGARPGRARFEGLADHVAAFGGHLLIDGTDAALREGSLRADVVLVRGPAGSRALHELAAARRDAGRPTVVDVTPGDVSIDRSGRVVLADELVALARVAGSATAPCRAVRDALVACGVRSLVVPTLLSRARIAELQAERATAIRGAERIIGWHTGSRRPDDSGARTAVLAAIADLLEAHEDLRVEVAGDAVDAVAELRDDPRVVVRPTPTVADVARWSVHCWTGSPSEHALAGDVRPAAEAQLLGVPTVVAAAHPAVEDGLVPCSLCVPDAGDADAWWRVLAPLLTGGHAWSARSTEVAARAQARFGPGSALAVVNRLLGWIRFEAAA